MTEQYDCAEDYFDVGNPVDVVRLRAACMQLVASGCYIRVQVAIHNRNIDASRSSQGVIEAQDAAAKCYAKARSYLVNEG